MSLIKHLLSVSGLRLYKLTESTCLGRFANLIPFQSVISSYSSFVTDPTRRTCLVSLYFKEFPLGIIPRPQRKKKEKRKNFNSKWQNIATSRESWSVALSRRKNCEKLVFAMCACVQVIQYEKIYLEIEKGFLLNKLSLRRGEKMLPFLKCFH